MLNFSKEEEGILMERLDMVLRGGSSFFRTERGHIGVGRRYTAENDTVCLFHGARFPAVIRNVEDRWFKWIGPSCIYGCTGGTYIREREAQGIEPVLYEIR